MSGWWYSQDTLPEEVPRTSFEATHSWKKPLLSHVELVLIQELIFLAKLPICHWHWRVLLSRTTLAKCRYLEGYSLDAPEIKELDAFNPNNLEKAIWDLAVDNKRTRLIRESMTKSIYHVTEIEPGNEFIKTMPTPTNL